VEGTKAAFNFVRPKTYKDKYLFELWAVGAGVCSVKQPPLSMKRSGVVRGARDRQGTVCQLYSTLQLCGTLRPCICILSLLQELEFQVHWNITSYQPLYRAVRSISPLGSPSFTKGTFTNGNCGFHVSTTRTQVSRFM
jgi:hypothetical protein